MNRKMVLMIMEFKKAKYSDVESIMEIVRQAQAYLKNKGIDQWQDNYPNTETVKNDIENGNEYILSENGNIAGIAAVCFDGDKCYEKIYDGKWLSNEKYAVIHRFAVHNNYKSTDISSCFIKNIEQLCLEKDIYSIKVDTHQNNESMKNLLGKNEFIYCGKVIQVGGEERVAFEKLLKNKTVSE